jgi:SCY1-like protein 1
VRYLLALRSFTDINSQLDELSDDFPEDFFKMRILPELLKSVEFGGGGPKVFGAIMKIGAKLSDDEYETKLVPVIVRLFASPDRALRVCLLDNLPLMIDRLPQKEVNGKIFPMIVSGFTDTAPIVREQTVRAVPTIIGKLSDRVINGELLRFLAKTANDEQPGIRTNTTICLGKIARNIGPSARTKVLLAAFTRSLRDPFVHARNAALTVLNGTIDVYSDDDCATKILPVVCMSLVDKEKIVREQANRTLDSYLQRVRKYALTMADTALQPSDGVNATSAPAARMGNQNDTSWAGWAISSFTNKVTTARGIMESTTNGHGKLAQSGSAPVSLPASGRATPTVQAQQVAGNQPQVVTASQQVDEVANFTGPDDKIDDGFDAWGTMDDEDDTFFDATASRKRTPSPGPATAFDDGGEPDFAGWLAAQSQAKAKRPLPRGLAKSTTGSSASLNVRPASANRAISTGGINSGVGASKLASTTMKPKMAAPVPKKAEVKTNAPEVTEDDWGDAWD